jgi:hypothetical protein
LPLPLRPSGNAPSAIKRLCLRYGQRHSIASGMH